MTSGGPMTVSILIVNWNSKDLLRQCLLSIRRTCVDLAPEIVVVDSGSFDGCAEMLAREFPEVERLPDAGIVSPRLLNTDLTPQSSVHALPS